MCPYCVDGVSAGIASAPSVHNVLLLFELSVEFCNFLLFNHHALIRIAREGNATKPAHPSDPSKLGESAVSFLIIVPQDMVASKNDGFFVRYELMSDYTGGPHLLPKSQASPPRVFCPLYCLECYNALFFLCFFLSGLVGWLSPMFDALLLLVRFVAFFLKRPCCKRLHHLAKPGTDTGWIRTSMQVNVLICSRGLGLGFGFGFG
jgi:hypothetical protein